MTIDEAIEHAKEVARTCDDSQCAADRAQLAEWLRQARGADKAGRWYTSKIRELESENASLRGAAHGLGELCDKYKAENAKLREFAEMFAKVADEVGCDHCPYCDPDLCDEETDPMKDGCRLYEELRELGVTDD